MTGKTKWAIAAISAIYLLVAASGTAAARQGWDCQYEGSGAGSARYMTHFDWRGRELIEPHWPAAIAYQILVDTRDILIAAHAYEVPPTFREDAEGAATVLVLNKVTGRLRRSSIKAEESGDEVSYGTCEER